MKSICFVLGTRPEITKMSPVIKECEKRKIPFFVIHTGQHYSYEMDKLIFSDLELVDPKYNLEVGSGSHGAQTGKMLENIEKILQEENPFVVLVQGDTNSVLAGALSAVKLGIKIGHIEAGLRSYDRSMPEETNRIIVDHISDFLFTPTSQAKDNLLREGIAEEKIFVTGNTIVDSVLQSVKIAKKKSKILNDHNLREGEYFFLTLHRAENVDKEERLKSLIEGIKNVGEKLNIPFIWPIHPRTKIRLENFNLWDTVISSQNIKIIDPVGFLDSLMLQQNARMVFSDSGGLQEESCILGVPCITLRDNTERPESVEVGANFIAGATPEKIMEGTTLMLRSKRNWSNPFGDGTTSKQIIDILLK